jgi:hypothetical protein
MEATMSHIATVKTEFKNVEILKKICKERKIKLEIGENLSHTFMEGKRTGIIKFQLKGWSHPVIIDAEGKAYFDNYQGHWGKIEELDSLIQDYSKEVTLETLQQQGYYVTENVVNENGEYEMVFMR